VLLVYFRIFIFARIFPFLDVFLFVLGNKSEKITHESVYDIFEDLIQNSQMLYVKLNRNFLNDISRSIFVVLILPFLLNYRWRNFLFICYFRYFNLFIFLFDQFYLISNLFV